MMRHAKHGLVFLFLLLFMGYYGGITLFPHVHDINGQRIVHSHPYAGTSSHPGHQHSTQQLQLLQWLSLLTWVGVAFFVGLFLCGYRRIHHAVTAPFIRNQYPDAYRLRGPPVACPPFDPALS